MSKARLVITAIEIEGRPVAEVIKAYDVSKSWTYELLARYRAEGDAALEPRSRRPHTSPTAIPQTTVDLIVLIRKQLAETGLDAGPETIAWHLQHHHQVTVSVSSIARTLTRQSLVEPQPNKRPKASYIRFQAEQPNETWQSDFTHYRLATGQDTEIITWLDDHSRCALHVSAHRRITGQIVLATFRETAKKQVLKLVDGLHVRVIDAATGELLRELTIDPTRNYQPLGRPPGPQPRKHRRPDPSPGSGLSGIS